jgi:type I restriction enzyme M protein
MKDGPKNRLRAQDIHKIVDVFNKRIEVEKYSRMVSSEEIERNEFNLNLPRYIDSQEPEDIQDIAGHLQGGIPAADVEALQSYWDVCPSLKSSLFRDLRPGYFELSIPASQLKQAIYSHPEFSAFIADMNGHFEEWRMKTAAALRGLEAGFHPKELIAVLGEDLLKHYTAGMQHVASLQLLDRYHIYQHLMDYWRGTMQDDCYLIAQTDNGGWKAETTRVIETDKKGKERDKGWTCDLIPKPLIVARYYAKEQADIDALVADLEAVTAKLAELEEEHGGEEGAFSELEKVNKASVVARLKELKSSITNPQLPTIGIEPAVESGDELSALETWLKLSNEEAELKKRLKECEAELDAKTYAHYPKLTEDEIKTLVADDKWLAALEAAIHGEMDRVSQSLTQRVKELTERYETPLPQITERVSELEEKVNRHLERMGFAWK